MRLYPYLLLLFLSSVFIPTVAQNTFIKRYKNTTLPEGSVAVANLPGNRIAIIGQQSNGFIWQSPMVVITDSAGNQLRHFVDTSCYGCVVYNGATDSKGFIYIVGNFYGKAGIVKYDTTGEHVWTRLYYPFGLTSAFKAVDVVNDSLIVAGGAHATDLNGGTAMLVAYNSVGDSLWSYDMQYSSTTDVMGISHDTSTIYATGVFSDTVSPFQKIIFSKVDYNGQNFYYKAIDNGRKWGYGIIPLTPDSILIGGWAVTMTNQSFPYISLVNASGDVLYTFQDSSYQSNEIVNMSYDFKDNMLYVYDYDTIHSGGVSVFHNHIGVYEFPFSSLQQPTWELTITGTDASSSRGLALAPDGSILHTATASYNCPHCPYLLKADNNTCADLITCDTFFVSDISIKNIFTASLKLYPNPITSDFVTYELVSDIPIHSVEISGCDISGREITLIREIFSDGVSGSKGRLMFNEEIASGMYVVKFTVNKRFNIYSRIIKLK